MLIVIVLLCFVGDNIPWYVSVPHYPTGMEAIYWNAEIHYARKQQFFNQYARQAEGVSQIAQRNQYRRAMKLARLRAGISPFTGKPHRQ